MIRNHLINFEGSPSSPLYKYNLIQISCEIYELSGSLISDVEMTRLSKLYRQYMSTWCSHFKILIKEKRKKIQFRLN